MTDPELSDLFAGGTAPERDAAFAARMKSEIQRSRLGVQLARMLVVSIALALAVAVYLAGRTVAPALVGIGEYLPEFMGVPVPLVLGALIIGLLFGAKRYLRLLLA